MTLKLIQAINAAVQALEDAGQPAAAQLLEAALHDEDREQALEDATNKGWSSELENPVGERVNPKVFAGKTIYNAWMKEGAILVIFQDHTSYTISGPGYHHIKRTR